MESFVVQLPFSPGFFEIEMTQTRYRRFKMGTKRGKPVGWFAFCFSLSPRSSEVLGQFLAFGGGSVLTGAWLCVPFCHSVYTLDQHRGSPFFLTPFPLPAPLYPEENKVIILFLFSIPHAYRENVLLPSAEGWYLVGFAKFAVLTHCKVLELLLHKLCIA